MTRAPVVGLLSTLDSPILPHILQSLLAAGVEGVCIIADSKVRSERDKGIWAQRTGGFFERDGLTVQTFAKHAIPTYLVATHNSADTLALLGALGLKLLVNAGTPRKIGNDIIAAARQGILNVHPGVLPKYRGATCVEWSIYNAEPVGNSAHFMSEGYDDGPILQTESYEFAPDASYSDIRTAVYSRGFDLMGRITRHVLDTGICAGDLPQQKDGTTFKPIDDAAMAVVLDRVLSGAFAKATQGRSSSSGVLS